MKSSRVGKMLTGMGVPSHFIQRKLSEMELKGKRHDERIRTYP